VPVTLPTFSRGLKLVRIAVFVMLLQLVLAVVMTMKALAAASTADVLDAYKWTQYFFLANVGAMVAMALGTARAIPELARARMSTRSLVVATAGFAIAAAAMGWTYLKLSTFIDLALDPEHALDELMAAAEDLESTSYLVIVKDFAYAMGLIAVVRTIERSASFNDQLALRDLAAHMTRALVVMLVGDLFYQLTYGLGTGGYLGVIASLLVLGYWIYCHARLQRFLFNAAWFVNEPHHLPVATVIRAEKPSTRAPTAPVRPSAPAVRAPAPVQSSAPAAPIVIVPPRAPEPTPRAYSESDDASDGPKFLR
jgi:hypothetical protein